MYHYKQSIIYIYMYIHGVYITFPYKVGTLYDINFLCINNL